MDFYHDDFYSGLKELHAKVAIPEFVKSAEMMSTEEVGTLPDQAFAWPEFRMFPAHTSQDTYVSCGYAFQKKADLPRYVYENLVKAAYAFEIQDEVTKLAHACVPVEKEPFYGLDIETNGHGRLQKYQMDEPEHVKLAQEYFDTNHTKYPMTWRKQIAGSIMVKAAEFGVPIMSKQVKIYSGDNVCDSPKMAMHVAARTSMIKDASDTAHLYMKLAKASIGSMNDPRLLMKLASVVEKLDRQEGLDKYYGTHYPNPYESVFNLSVKEAQDRVDVVDILGTRYPLDDLASMGSELYKQALGSDFADEISEGDTVSKEKLAMHIAALPRPEKSILAKHLDQILAGSK